MYNPLATMRTGLPLRLKMQSSILAGPERSNDLLRHVLSSRPLSPFFLFSRKDDIVYPELTVRENLMYSGRFRLPQGTTEGMTSLQ